MSCYDSSSNPSDENLLLIGPTSYKKTILKAWLESVGKDPETYFLTKNTEVQNLIGASSLDDDNKLGLIRDQMKNNYEESFGHKLEDKQLNDIIVNDKLCTKYIKECYNYLNELKESLKDNKDSSLKIITSFHLGIIPRSFIYGNCLILKGIESPQPSVIERFNSILENPRYLELTEDNQQIYNNSNIFEKIYNNNNKLTLPNNSKFKIIFTSRNIHKKSLSEALFQDALLFIVLVIKKNSI